MKLYLVFLCAVWCSTDVRGQPDPPGPEGQPGPPGPEGELGMELPQGIPDGSVPRARSLLDRNDSFPSEPPQAPASVLTVTQVESAAGALIPWPWLGDNFCSVRHIPLQYVYLASPVRHCKVLRGLCANTPFYRTQCMCSNCRRTNGLVGSCVPVTWDRWAYVKCVNLFTFQLTYNWSKLRVPYFCSCRP